MQMWQMQEAKARLSEVVKSTKNYGPWSACGSGHLPRHVRKING